jgi:hypothetical protein
MSRLRSRRLGTAVAGRRPQQDGSEWGQGVQDRVGVAVAGDQAGVAQYGGVMAGRRGGTSARRAASVVVEPVAPALRMAARVGPSSTFSGGESACEVVASR